MPGNGQGVVQPSGDGGVHYIAGKLEGKHHLAAGHLTGNRKIWMVNQTMKTFEDVGIDM
jgi:hypothetical protein